MSGVMNSALDGHLQRFDTRSDDGDDTNSDTSETGTVHQPVQEEPSFFSLVFADTASRRDAVFAALARWWEEHQPLIIQFIRQYGVLLVKLLAPLTPRAARRAGFRGASHELLRSLDRLDSKIPGGERSWSRRWRGRSRAENREAPLAWLPISMDGTLGGVGTAAAAVVFTAVSWCSWRRSATSWPILLLEMVFGSAWMVNYIAREDGLREAKLFEARLVALENSLGPFFCGVQACLRMVRCSQTLSFGLRLSVPMPPVARMEGGESATGSGTEASLREVRLVLADILEGGIEQTKTYGARKRNIDTLAQTPPEDTDQFYHAGEGSPSRLLASIVRSEKQLAADLRRLIIEVAEKMDKAIETDSDLWGMWWDSEMENTSDAMRDLAKYFEAAAYRLEVLIGPSQMVFPTFYEPDSRRDIEATAEALSALRLHYEDVLVRLYFCQRDVSFMLRDPARRNEDGWIAVREGLAQARAAIESPDRVSESELWERLEKLVECSERDGVQSGTDLSPGASSSLLQISTSRGSSRHLESGVEWVSLTTPPGQDPSVFEGGNVQEGSEETVEPPPPEPSVTDVLVGVSSPERSNVKDGKEHCRVAEVDCEELLNERSRSQLVGELDSVLRTRSLPPVCEKHLPVESQKSLENWDEEEIFLKDGSLDDSFSVDKSAPPEPHVVQPSACGKSGNQDLLSELRAQLSMAANEEIFSSERMDDCNATIRRDATDGHDLVEDFPDLDS